MISEGVMHQIAGAKSGGKKGSRSPEKIFRPALRFVNRARRLENPAKAAGRHRRQSAEGAVLFLTFDQV